MVTDGWNLGIKPKEITLVLFNILPVKLEHSFSSISLFHTLINYSSYSSLLNLAQKIPSYPNHLYRIFLVNNLKMLGEKTFGRMGVFMV